jgi:hypothetical protein
LVHVFFNEQGSPVEDPALLQQLALAAWTRERLVVGTEVRTGAASVSSILQASQTIWTANQVQDLFARGMAEALEFLATRGTSLAKVVPSLLWGEVKQQLVSSPQDLLFVSAQIGLNESKQKYSELLNILPPADATTLDVTILESVRQLYDQAYILELPNEALATALMPTTLTQQLLDIFGSMVSEVIPGLPSDSERVTLAGLLTLSKSIAVAGQSYPAFQNYSSMMNRALTLVQAQDRLISSWAAEAAAACAPRQGAPQQ